MALKDNTDALRAILEALQKLTGKDDATEEAEE